MKKPFCFVIGIVILSLPSITSANDVPVYQCPGPSDTILFTNKEQEGCRPMALAPLTIAPTRTYPDSVTSPGYSLRPFPMDWYDHTSPVGSLRNRIIRNRPYGMQHWLDYNAPVGSMRNSVETWPSPFGLYGW